MVITSEPTGSVCVYFVIFRILTFLNTRSLLSLSEIPANHKRPKGESQAVNVSDSFNVVIRVETNSAILLSGAPPLVIAILYFCEYFSWIQAIEKILR